MPVSEGKSLCWAHDPETRAKAQKAGGEATAKDRRAKYLPTDESDSQISYETRRDLRRTMQWLSRRVVAGELDSKAVNAACMAANCALQSFAAEDLAAKRCLDEMSDEDLQDVVNQVIAARQKEQAA